MITARLSSADKLTLAKNIVAHAQSLLAEFGKPEKISGHQFACAQIGDFKIIMVTPFSGVKTGHGDFHYQVDMWHSKIGKVFGASWAPQKRWANEFECFRLVKGEWIDSFFACEKS
ncbi:MAG: hypothetical protein WC236_00050 [Gallionellaceae bacterium]|jgi:hypothetical protein